MNPLFNILSKYSLISDALPIIPFLFYYNKMGKAFKVFLVILCIGLINDLITHFRHNLHLSVSHLLITDIYEIMTFLLMLYFFFILNAEKHIKRYFIVFFIGCVFQILDWLFISKFKINSIYASLFYYIVYCYLCLDKINYQIINETKSNNKVDLVLVFCISIFIFYSYILFTLALYCLNIPLNIKIPSALYNVVIIANIIVNSIMFILLMKIPKKNIQV